MGPGKLPGVKAEAIGDFGSAQCDGLTGTVDHIDAMGVRVHCLALGGFDLTSPAGKMTCGS